MKDPDIWEAICPEPDINVGLFVIDVYDTEPDSKLFGFPIILLQVTIPESPFVVIMWPAFPITTLPVVLSAKVNCTELDVGVLITEGMIHYHYHHKL